MHLHKKYYSQQGTTFHFYVCPAPRIINFVYSNFLFKSFVIPYIFCFFCMHQNTKKLNKKFKFLDLEMTNNDNWYQAVNITMPFYLMSQTCKKINCCLEWTIIILHIINKNLVTQSLLWYVFYIKVFINKGLSNANPRSA